MEDPRKETDWGDFFADFIILLNLMLDFYVRYGGFLPSIKALHSSQNVASTSPTGPTICGVLATKFTQEPYIEIDRGRVRNGRNGEILISKILVGAQKAVLAHLLIHGWIHMIQVIAFQSKSGTRSLSDRKRLAEATICKLKKAIRGSGVAISKRAQNRNDVVWVLTRDRPAVVEFSVDHADVIAERAGDALEKGNPQSALSSAMEAIKIDGLIQLAHEVACEAALKLDPRDPAIKTTIAKSFIFIRNRIEQLVRGHAILEQSLDLLDDENQRDELGEVNCGFDEEVARLRKILERIIAMFGDPTETRTPQDILADDAIEKIRQQGLTVEKASRSPDAKQILNHPAAERWRNKIETEVRESGKGNPIDARRDYNDYLIWTVVDSGCTPRIRLICKNAFYEARKALSVNNDKSVEKSCALELVKVENLFFIQCGHLPTVDELALELAWTVEKVHEILELIRRFWPNLRDELNRKPKNRPSSQDDDDDDPGDIYHDEGDSDEDDDFGGQLVRR